MQFSIYLFRVTLVAVLSTGFFLWLKQAKLDVNSAIAYLIYIGIPILSFILLAYLPVEIVLRKRNFGWWINGCPALGGICAALFVLIVPGVTSKALTGLVVSGAVSGMMWAATSALNGRHPPPFIKRR